MTAATAFGTELLDLATQTVTIIPATGRNNYGEPSFGASSAYKAYVQRVTSSGMTLEQDPFIIEYKAYIPHPSLTVTLSDEVTFPDGKTRPIISVDVRYDEYGQQAVVLSCGR
jgi:hypothetical protein